MKKFALLALSLPAFSLVSCRSSVHEEVQVADDLVIHVREAELGDGDGPIGWIYAIERGDDPNLCLYLWRDGTWTLGAEETRGWYGDTLAQGVVEDQHVRGLPADAFAGAGKVYLVGALDAWLGIDPIPKGLDG